METEEVANLICGFLDWEPFVKPSGIAMVLEIPESEVRKGLKRLVEEGSVEKYKGFWMPIDTKQFLKRLEKVSDETSEKIRKRLLDDDLILYV